MMLKRDEINNIKREYPGGTCVKLISTKETHTHYINNVGLEGIVTHVDDIGQIHVIWSNGSTSPIVLEDGIDTIEVVRKAEDNKKDYVEKVLIRHFIKAHEEGRCDCDLRDEGTGFCTAGAYLQGCTPIDDVIEEHAKKVRFI